VTTAIETTGLTKFYRRTRGIEDLNLTVERGEIFGFLGPNGAGKTTTIRMLLGLIRPTRGKARVLGMDPWSQSVEVHRRVGYLPGEFALFDRLTGREHVDWFIRARGGGTPTGVVDLLEDLDVVVDRPAGQLSKGNKQKLGIVIAMMHRPKLLVLDEPTPGLDPLVQDSFYRLLRELASEGTTIFLSSHDLDEVQRIADRVAIIRDGLLVVTETIERLRANAPRSIEIVLQTPVDAQTFEKIEGVRNLRINGVRVSLELNGAVAPFLREVAHLDPADLIVRRADLEELFLEYYREGERGRVG
jgi:ABC-2 type transport system ATP-binding protein